MLRIKCWPGFKDSLLRVQKLKVDQTRPFKPPEYSRGQPGLVGSSFRYFDPFPMQGQDSECDDSKTTVSKIGR